MDKPLGELIQQAAHEFNEAVQQMHQTETRVTDAEAALTRAKAAWDQTVQERNKAANKLHKLMNHVPGPFEDVEDEGKV